MSVTEALKRTPKGQLSYERCLNHSKLSHDLDQLSSPPLSGPHIEREFSLLNLSFGLDPSSFLDNSLSLSNGNANNNINNSNDNRNVSQNEKSPEEQNLSIAEALGTLDEIENMISKETSLKDTLTFPEMSPSNPSQSQNEGISPCPIFTRYSESSFAILEEEKLWDTVTKQSMLKRRYQFEDHDLTMRKLMKQKEFEMRQKIKNLINQRDSLVEQCEQKSKQKELERLQKLKEGHEKHQKKIDTKHQEIERKREKLEEEEKKRHEIELSKLNQLRLLFKDFETQRATFLELRQVSDMKDKLPEVIDKSQEFLDKASASLKDQLSDSERSQLVSTERLSKFIAYREESGKRLEHLKEQLELLREKAKEDEKREVEQKKKELEKQEEEKKLKEQAQDFQVQTMAFVLRDKQLKEKILTDAKPVVQAFAANVQMKKYRFDLQRAVNTPINAISAVSGAHLRDKLQNLHGLLSGHQVQVAGKQVSAGQSKEGMAFCQNLIPKMLVKKGEEQVTSNHESAFAIAAVAIGLWADFPIVGDLFLAHLQSVCPYVLPFYSIRKEGQSTQEYHRSIGYKIDEDGTVEEQDKFLHRMSGVMRLYCACMVSTPPKGANSPHPHGIDNAWTWLCRTLNMEPQPDITAAMIFDVLSVTGYFLFQEYKIQFVKLLYLLHKSYLPKLKSVSITNSTVGRLEIFLENAIQNNAKVEPPKGLLPTNFWLS